MRRMVVSGLILAFLFTWGARSWHAQTSAAAAVGPTADFSATPTTWNAPSTVTFTDHSSSNVFSWLWDFGDGTQSLHQNPVHRYPNPGTYTVSLTVNAPNGTATSIKAGYITVQPHVPVGEEYLVTVDPSAHQRFGLYYPATYKFRLPSGAPRNLSAQYRYWEGTWNTLPEKRSSDYFNGIDAVRFDWAAGYAYISVRFSRSSNNLYLRVIDGNGSTWPLQFDSIPGYYDDRDAVVTLTLDDWNIAFDSYFRTAVGYLAADNLYFSVAVIAGNVTWSSVQQKINQVGDLMEIASHSIDHPCTAADYLTHGYQTEAAGSVDAITNNLNFNASPYVPLYIEPCGYSDDPLQAALTSAGYLLSRSANNNPVSGMVFVRWDPTMGRYGRAAVTYDDDVNVDDVNLLTATNAAFDRAVAQGAIYHLMDHPSKGLWHDNSYLLQHLDHIKGRTNLWYVPFGQLYEYHFLQEMRGNLGIQHLAGPSQPSAAFSGSPLSGFYPLTVDFTDASTGTVTGWLWDFGDGQTATGQNPRHLYSAAGGYSVTLTVSGPGGSSSDTQAGYVSVTEPIPASVSITAPAGGASYIVPARIPVTVNPTAGSGATITGVDFYAGATLLGSDSSSPYTFNWTGAAAGSYSLTARVTDSLGASAISPPVSIKVVNASLPSPWMSQDIGKVAVAGSTGYLEGAFAEIGSGTDIWGSTDAFRYTYQPVAGDGEVVARIAYLQDSHPYAKAGVMIRETLAPNASHATIDLTPEHGSEFLTRPGKGASTSVSNVGNVAAPYWVKLVRSGKTFSGYISADGVSWKLVGTDTIGMADPVYLGLAVTSHGNGSCMATIDSVSFAPAAPVVQINAPLDGASFQAPATVPVSVTALAGLGAGVARVDYYAGTAPVGSSTAAPFDFSWEDLPAGRYTLTARVTDSAGTTAASAPVTVSVVNPAKKDQAIKIVTAAPASAPFGSTFTVAAVADGGPVTYCSAGGCTNSGPAFTMTSGSVPCTVRYDQPGDALFNPAAQMTSTTRAAKAGQAITITAPVPASAKVGSSFTVAATAPAGPVSYSSAGGCTNDGASFTLTGMTKACTVMFDQPGNDSYSAASQLSSSLWASKGGQAITVTTPAPATASFGTSFTVAATAPGGPVSYSSAGGCSNSGASFTMTSGTIACGVLFDQGGSADYTAAAQVVSSTSASRAGQAITITQPAPAGSPFGANFTVAATAPGGPVSYSSAGGCSNSGANFTMTSGSSPCTVSYRQPGDANYNGAAALTSQTSAGKAPQAIAITTPAPPLAPFGSTFTVAASAPGGAVSYGSAGGCSNSGATFTMTSGTVPCTVDFEQVGNENYDAAAPKTAAVAAGKATQSITIATPAPASAPFGSTFAVAASASGGTVAYSSSGGCSNSGAVFTITSGTAPCTVLYDQGGSAGYDRAPQRASVTNPLVVPPGAPSIGTVSVADGIASVSFSAPSFTGGSPITGYTVTANPGNLTASGTASPIGVSGLISGTLYSFAVTARNPAGTGAPSSAASATVSLPSGDLNGDGVVDIQDAMLALRISVGLQAPSSLMLARGDVAPLLNNVPKPDGKIDMGDVVVILRKSVGLASW